jgi:polysaccharide deacetylase 2 family uncharacterized protein YibQ
MMDGAGGLTADLPPPTEAGAEAGTEETLLDPRGVAGTRGAPAQEQPAQEQPAQEQPAQALPAQDRPAGDSEARGVPAGSDGAAATGAPADDAGEAADTARPVIVLPQSDGAPVGRALPEARGPLPGFSAARPVETGRLPVVGGPAADAPGAPDGGAEAAVSPPLDADAPAWQRFAMVGAVPASGPVVALMLLDPGLSAAERDAWHALDLAFAVVIDPMRDDAAPVAADWRSRGREVVMLATGLPEGATPADLEVSFAAHFAAIPEAVAVLDTAARGLQSDRRLAEQVATILAEAGQGLILREGGLTQADQVAQAAGLAGARVYREIDDADQNAPTIRRMLDRAVFEAARSGRVLVLGRMRAETRAGLEDWLERGRASEVTVGPATAALWP